MSNIRMMALAFALASLMVGATASAQSTSQQPRVTPSDSAMTANPELQRQLSPKRRAMRKQKRAACEQQAADQKLHLTKRWRFMRQCLKS
ncbi:MAG: hypothetical protein AB1490_18935 [Pseudomonadota bacterium]